MNNDRWSCVAPWLFWPVRANGLRVLMIALFGVAACGVSFHAGFQKGSRLSESRVFEAGRAQFLEFLKVAVDLGIVELDMNRLQEVIDAGQGPVASLATN